MVLDFLLELSHLVLDSLDGLWIADVISLDIRLRQERVVHRELRVEAQCACRRQEKIVVVVKRGFYMVSHEPTQSWNDYTIVFQQ